MKKKSALIITAIIIMASIILYFVPLKTIIGNLPFIKDLYNNTTLEIITQKGKAKIWINGKEYGETPSTIENLSEGSYDIELEKISEDGSFYKKQSFKIELSQNTSARIDIEIGPEDIIHGTILYYTPIPKTSDSKGLLTLTSNAEKAKVYLDKEYAKDAPVNGLSLIENQYQIKISATGYEEIDIPVFVRQGYNLNLKTYHFPIPVTFDNVNTNE